MFCIIWWFMFWFIFPIYAVLMPTKCCIRILHDRLVLTLRNSWYTRMISLLWDHRLDECFGFRVVLTDVILLYWWRMCNIDWLTTTLLIFFGFICKLFIVGNMLWCQNIILLFVFFIYMLGNYVFCVHGGHYVLRCLY